MGKLIFRCRLQGRPSTCLEPIGKVRLAKQLESAERNFPSCWLRVRFSSPAPGFQTLIDPEYQAVTLLVNSFRLSAQYVQCAGLIPYVHGRELLPLAEIWNRLRAGSLS